MTSQYWQNGWADCLAQVPIASDFFSVEGLPLPQDDQGLGPYWQGLEWEVRRNLQDDLGLLVRRFDEFVAQMEAFRLQGQFVLKSLQILGGTDKKGQREDFSLTLKPGDVVCVVGPTGSGKSRLLADIECLAQGDTPTHRRILVNGTEPGEDLRYSVDQKLVAQLSQNMNFVMDLNVGDFLLLHAQSRLLADAQTLAVRVWEAASGLAGESFGLDTPLTQLSGGQSRALMIADAALLSPKPIILIDEIENAGVDRLKALDFFKSEGKIVFLSTHDPLLALSGNLRLVIAGGGVRRCLQADPGESKLLPPLEAMDRQLGRLRAKLRSGETLKETDLDP